MNHHSVSLEGDSLEDSRGETELERLRDELKRKTSLIEEKTKIISSLRQQVDDFQREAEELENNEQIMRQKLDRLKKEQNEKDETIESISHALREMETANESLNKRLNARAIQVQKFADDLAKTKQELEEVKSQNDANSHQKELLEIELENAKRSLRDRGRDSEEALCQEVHDLKVHLNNLKQQNANLMTQVEKYRQHIIQQDERQNSAQLDKENSELKAIIKKLREHNESLSAQIKLPRCNSSSLSDQTNEEMVQELYDLRAKVKSLSHRQSRRSIDEEILKLKQELEVTETSWKLEKHHKERYARENMQLERKIADLTKEINELRKNYSYLENRTKEIEMRHREDSIPPPLPPKVSSQHHERSENKTEITAAIHFSVADEVGEFMDKSSSIPASQSKENRMEHFNAHRIQKSQFFLDDPIAEQKMRLERANELARRNMQVKPLHQTSYPLELDTFDVSNLTETQIKKGYIPKHALNDSSNQRRQVKKAEAFVI